MSSALDNFSARYSVNLRRALYGSVFPFDEERAREKVTAAYDQCFYPQGIMRQLVATRTSRDRTSNLASITTPTLIIHGSEDPRVPVQGGKDTAKAIPGAQLLIIDGMGHSYPPETWSQIINAMTENASKAYE